MAASASNISSCGRCHSGSAREALLEGENPSVTLTNDYNVAITCAVCHDPHQAYVWTNDLNGVITFTNQLTGNAAIITNNELGPIYTNQLRNPYASTNDFFLTTSDVFSNKYNPNINVCAQCHNDRGSAWTDTSRSPHHSPQYNMLLGTVGVLADGTTPLPFHALAAGNAMRRVPHADGHEQSQRPHLPGGHVSTLFQLPLRPGPAWFQVCDQRHFESNPADEGACWICGPPTTRRRNCGRITEPSPGNTRRRVICPRVAVAQRMRRKQAMIPPTSCKARFDLYLVLYDGSYGVHNAPYDIELLQTAQSLVEGQLYQ